MIPRLEAFAAGVKQCRGRLLGLARQAQGTDGAAAALEWQAVARSVGRLLRRLKGALEEFARRTRSLLRAAGHWPG